MSQSEWVKTQVRLPASLHNDLSEYAKKHNKSLNGTIVEFISKCINDDIFDTTHSRQDYEHLIDELLPEMEMSDLKQVCNLILRLKALN